MCSNAVRHVIEFVLRNACTVSYVVFFGQLHSDCLAYPRGFVCICDIDVLWINI